jgi:Polysaccharide lyase
MWGGLPGFWRMVAIALAVSAGPVFRSAFAEDTGFDPLAVEELSAPGTVKIIADPTGDAPTSKVYSFRIPSGYCNPQRYDPGSPDNDCDQQSVRSQMWENVFATKKNANGQPKQSWYGFSVYFPADFPYGPRQTKGLLSLFYFHNRQCAHVALQTQAGVDDAIYVAMSNSAGNHQCTPGPQLKVADFKDLLGKWTRFELFIKWAKDKSGQVKVYVDGKFVTEFDGPTFTLGLESVNYAKFGLYLCCAENVAKVQEASIYYAAVRRADQREGLFTAEDAVVLKGLQTTLQTLRCGTAPANGVFNKQTRDAALSCRSFPDSALPADLNVGTLRTFASLYAGAGVADLPTGTLREPEPEVALVSNAKGAAALPANLLKPAFVAHTFETQVQRRGHIEDVNSNFDVKLEEVPGVAALNFGIAGRYSYERNAFSEFELFFIDPVKVTAALSACQGGIITFPDGTTHVHMTFNALASGDLVATNADCLIAGLPKKPAAQVQFLVTNFADVAIGSVVDGTVDLMQHDGLKSFFQRVAVGEIKVGK